MADLSKRREEDDTFLEEDHKIAGMFWDELARMNPSEVSRRTLASHNETEKAYELRLLTDELLVRPEKREVVRVSEPVSEGDPAPDFSTVLVAVHYLLRAREEPIANEYIAHSQVTDGAFFFKGPHALPTWRIEKKLGDSAAAFLEKGKLIGGAPVEFGDAAVELLVLPRVRIAYVLWEGDDEFPARSQILFDASADKHFALDVMWAMCNLVTEKLLRA